MRPVLAFHTRFLSCDVIFFDVRKPFRTKWREINHARLFDENLGGKAVFATAANCCDLANVHCMSTFDGAFCIAWEGPYSRRLDFNDGSQIPGDMTHVSIKGLLCVREHFFGAQAHRLMMQAFPRSWRNWTACYTRSFASEVAHLISQVFDEGKEILWFGQLTAFSTNRESSFRIGVTLWFKREDLTTWCWC